MVDTLVYVYLYIYINMNTCMVFAFFYHSSARGAILRSCAHDLDISDRKGTTVHRWMRGGGIEPSRTYML